MKEKTSNSTSTEAVEQEKLFVMPKEVAVLPVRDMVLFPHAVLPLTVGRESSVKLINSLGDDKILAIVAQRDSRTETPARQGRGQASGRNRIVEQRS